MVVYFCLLYYAGAKRHEWESRVVNLGGIFWSRPARWHVPYFYLWTPSDLEVGLIYGWTGYGPFFGQISFLLVEGNSKRKWKSLDQQNEKARRKRQFRSEEIRWLHEKSLPIHFHNFFYLARLLPKKMFHYKMCNCKNTFYVEPRYLHALHSKKKPFVIVWLSFYLKKYFLSLPQGRRFCISIYLLHRGTRVTPCRSFGNAHAIYKEFFLASKPHILRAFLPRIGSI